MNRSLESSSPTAPVPVRIERLVFRGDGLGHLPDGRVVFVPLSAPEDLLAVRLAPGQGDFARGRTETLLEPSPLRVPPACRHFGTCGGCQWQHIDYAGQVAWKAEILRELALRVGKLSPLPPIAPPLTPLPLWSSRARAQFKVTRGPRPQIGFHQRESHLVVDLDTCPLLHPTLNALLQGLRRLRTPALGELCSGLTEVWAAAGTESGEASLALFGRVRERAALRLLYHRLRDVVPGLQGIALLEGDPRRQPRVVDRHGLGALTDTVGNHRFRVDATAFFQVSGTAAAALTAELLRAACLTGAERVLDLYCGVGTFTVPLAARAREVVGVEAHPAAWGDAVHNLAAAGCGNARVLRAETERALAELPGGAWDLAVLDPPRQGASRPVLEALGRLAVP
ncbi:MAG: 23S rRNA (uracil(1939)-C(5))-methyltransferase RlmD, partial [Candidatus Methylomirabilota bacterium]